MNQFSISIDSWEQLEDACGAKSLPEYASEVNGFLL
jgi:hypothetical protein